MILFMKILIKDYFYNYLYFCFIKIFESQNPPHHKNFNGLNFSFQNFNIIK
jgi:hypothetical protein